MKNLVINTEKLSFRWIEPSEMQENEHILLSNKEIENKQAILPVHSATLSIVHDVLCRLSQFTKINDQTLSGVNSEFLSENTKNLLLKKIIDLKISTRAYNCLVAKYGNERKSFIFMYDVFSKYKKIEEIRGIRSIGEKTFSEIKEIIEGLKLPDSVWNRIFEKKKDIAQRPIYTIFSLMSSDCMKEIRKILNNTELISQFENMSLHDTEVLNFSYDSVFYSDKFRIFDHQFCHSESGKDIIEKFNNIIRRFYDDEMTTFIKNM